MILVSAGHHPGARGACYRNFCEYEEAVSWRNKIIQLLGDEGVLVPTGKLAQKVAFINARQASMAIEIHFNSAKVNGKHVGRGCEVLYCPGSDKGRKLALLAVESIQHLFKPSRGAKEGWYRMDKPGQVDYHGDIEGDETPDYFLKKTRCPALIIEPEFIHHKELINHYRNIACEAIVEALT